VVTLTKEERVAELEAELAELRPTPPAQKKAHEQTVIEDTGVPNSVQDRQARKAALIKEGFSLEQLDGGNPKVDYYRHALRLKPNGAVFKGRDRDTDGEIGKLIPNQPGDQITALKLAKRGLLPWPPNETCECRACRDRNGTERTGKVFMTPAAVQKMATARPVTFDGPEEVEYVIRPEIVMPKPDDVESVTTTTVSINDETYPLAKGTAVTKQIECPDCEYKTKVKAKRPQAAYKLHRRAKHK
jgi:DNA-directed RNA polymerase subunit RPC12/RpoP